MTAKGRLSIRMQLAATVDHLRSRLRPRPDPHRTIFTDIYRRGMWANNETVSGPGSTRERAAAFRGDLIALMQQLDVRVLLDVGCGDFNWMVDVGDSVETYIGVDVVPDLITRNVQRYGSPRRTFLCRTVMADPLPRADLVLCRDCLVHFSLADIHAAVRNLVRSESKYLLTTTFLDTRLNAEVETGGWRELNLEQAPFFFPPPVALIDERCLHTEGRYRSKRLALWALNSFPAETGL